MPMGVAGRQARIFLLNILAVLTVLASSTCSAEVHLLVSAALVTHSAQAEHSPAEPETHGLPQSAVEVGRIRGFPITNSMVVTWIVALGLIVFAHFATRNMKAVPTGAQNFFEWLVERVRNVFEGIIGGVPSLRG